MAQQIAALEKNGTQTKDCPFGKMEIGCKWVYHTKYRLDGMDERLNAWFVTRENTKKEGIDYTKTFAPVAKMVSV